MRTRALPPAAARRPRTALAIDGASREQLVQMLRQRLPPDLAGAAARPLPPLAHEAVTEASAEIYTRSIRRLLKELLQLPVPQSTADYDWMLSHIVSQWGLGLHERAHVGNTLHSALIHFCPELTDRVPVLERSLQGWRKIDPARQRSPLTRLCVGAIASWFCEHGEPEAAGITVLSYDALFREQDWTRLHGRDIHAQGNDVAITLWKCKTGDDQGLLLCDPVAKAIALGAKSAAADNEHVFHLSQQEYVDRFHQAVAALSLPAADNGLAWVPHCLRHAGASELHRAGWSLTDIKLRGRWTGDKSLARYTKAHQLIRLDSRLDAATRARGTAFWSDPAMAFGRTA